MIVPASTAMMTTTISTSMSVKPPLRWKAVVEWRVLDIENLRGPGAFFDA